MSYKNIHPFQPGLRAIYVNHTSGSDGYAGTITEPVATIQEAVNRFKPLDRGVQTWDLNDDRAIIVQDPGGDSTFDEEVVIPPHAGDGALHIKADYIVAHSGLVEAGTPFSTLSGFEVRQRLTFTTTPMTPGVLADGYFAVPDTNYLGNPYEYGWDYLPIVENGDGYVDVVALDPGTWTAFNHFAAATVDIVAPKLIWRPGTTDSLAYYSSACIKNMGGALIVEGFKFQQPQTFTSNIVISNVMQDSDSGNGDRVYLRGCIIDDNASSVGFTSVVVGDSCSIAGCIFKANNASISNGARALTLVNTRFADTSTYYPYFHSSEITVWGGDVDISTNAWFYLDSGTNARVFLDIRGGALYIIKSSVNIQALSVENNNSGWSNLYVDSHSSAIINSALSPSVRLVGSTGNTTYGLHIVGMNSSVYTNINPTSATLSGSSGDVKVGANPVRSWSAGEETDLTNLSRLGGW